MSADYHLHCLDCKERLGAEFHGFHAEDLSRLSRWTREGLFARMGHSSDPRLTFDGCLSGEHVSLADLADHSGHRVVVMSECGEIMNTCAARVLCPACQGHLGYCRREPGHTGTHEPEEP